MWTHISWCEPPLPGVNSHFLVWTHGMRTSYFKLHCGMSIISKNVCVVNFFIISSQNFTSFISQLLTLFPDSPLSTGSFDHLTDHFHAWTYFIGGGAGGDRCFCVFLYFLELQTTSDLYYIFHSWAREAFLQGLQFLVRENDIGDQDLDLGSTHCWESWILIDCSADRLRKHVCANLWNFK